VQQSMAMIRRECPGCTCGIESSLAMKNAVSSAFFELSRLINRDNENAQERSAGAVSVESKTPA